MTATNAELVQVHYQKLKNINFCITGITSGWCHEHSCLEIGVVLNGTAQVITAAGTYSVTTGDLLLFNAYEPHTIQADVNADILFLQLAPSFGKEYFARVAGVEFESVRLHLQDPAIKEQILKPLLSAAMAFFAEPQAFGVECMAWVAHMFTAMLRNIPYKINSDSEFLIKKKRIGRQQRIAGFVEQHYREKLTLSHLAQAEGITTAYMSRIFAELFQTPFQEYLSKLRLQKAIPMLKKQDVYLVDICMECGFSDTRYLNAVCQKEFGCTAAQLRDKMQDPAWQPTGTTADETGGRYDDATSLRMLQSFLDKYI